MNETISVPLSILVLTAVLIIVAITAFPARAEDSRFQDKVRIPVLPGIEWFLNMAIKTMVAPNLADTGSDPPLATDIAAEALMGAFINASALSNGRLFVEISPWAGLTVPRWPNPAFSDQLRYFTLSDAKY